MTKAVETLLHYICISLHVILVDNCFIVFLWLPSFMRSCFLPQFIGWFLLVYFSISVITARSC